MTNKFTHAYKQAPWRQKIRGMAWVFAVVIAFIVIALTNLNISARTYATGIETQMLYSDKEALNQSIADLNSQLGVVTSFSYVSVRFSESGYHTFNNSEEIVYLSVPGYQPPGLEIDLPSSVEKRASPILKPVYTQSLWDLLLEGAVKLSKNSLR